MKIKVQILLVIAMMGASLPGITGAAENTGSRSAVMQPLKVSASGRYFETADGRPWFWLGDTAWSLLEAYTPAEQQTYLAARAKLGFTIIQMVAVWDGGTGTVHGLNPNADTSGVQPWRNRDPLQPNEAYWKNVDAVIAAAARDGLYVGLLPSWGSYVTDYKMITIANAEAYGRWLGHRYRNAPNVVWIEGGDRDVMWTAGAKPEFVEAANVWRAMARGLQEGDGGIHPITFHPGGTLRDNQQEKWLAADMIQTWAWYKNIPEQLAVDYARKPTKPVILAEGAYEDGPEYPTGPITPLLVRRQAYWTYLSGAFFTYGHNDMWRKNPTWQASLMSEGARDMQVLHRIFDSIAWWELRPNPQFFASGEGCGKTLNMAAISKQGDFSMVYFSTPGTAELQLSQMKKGKLRAVWIDPRSGAHSGAVMASTAEGKLDFTTPAGWQDALLLIESR